MSRFERLIVGAAPMVCALAIWFGFLLRGARFGPWVVPIVTAGVLLLVIGTLRSRVLAESQWHVGWLILFLAIATISGLAQPVTDQLQGLPWLESLGAPIRAIVRDSVVGISPDSSALVLGVTDGDVSLLNDSLKQQFKDLNLSHLTAVSGANCAILLGVVGALLRAVGLRRKAIMFTSVVILASYIVLVGDQPSVIRAAGMGLVALFALGFGNRVKAQHMLAFAVTATLCLFPNFASSLGFQLSVVATAGLLFLSPRLTVYLCRVLPASLASAVAVALSAQVVCLPILIALQPNPSSASVLANIASEPAVAPVTILGLVATVCAITPVHILGAVGHLGFYLASLPASYIVWLAHFLLMNFPSLRLPGGFAGQIWALGCLVAVVLALTKRKVARWSAAVFSAGLLLTLLLGLRANLPKAPFAPKGWVMVACDVGQGDATVLRAGDQYAVIDVGKDDLPIDRCLQRLGITRINLLVLTHFDLDHVGGVGGALRGRRVDRALLTQFVDPRPGAEIVERILKTDRVPITKVALGDSGVLGSPGSSDSLGWLVLTPHRLGADSVSSNDGSVAMFWRGSKLAIFTMADLPATGQARILDELPLWWNEDFRSVPIVLKVSHHGSADQDPDFLAWVHPLISTISVGVGNPYGHPTQKALGWLAQDSAMTLRTDELGSISITPVGNGELAWGNTGAG